MKAYQLTILVIDHDQVGEQNVVAAVEDAKYVNPTVLEVKERDLGEWRDDHPLNNRTTMKEAAQELFADTPPAKPDLVTEILERAFFKPTHKLLPRKFKIDADLEFPAYISWVNIDGGKWAIQISHREDMYLTVKYGFNYPGTDTLLFDIPEDAHAAWEKYHKEYTAWEKNKSS